PCPACSGGVTAIGFLHECSAASPDVLEGTPEEIAGKQSGLLLEWAQRCPHTTLSVAHLPKLGGGSEHIVFFQEETPSQVVKCNREGIYGEIYYIEDGRINQWNCSPFQYLLRLRLWKKLFGVAPKDCGITPLGQIVSTAQFISASKSQYDSLLAAIEAKMK